MKRSCIVALFLTLVGLAWTQGSGVSGNGKMRFRVLYNSTHLPAEAQKVLKAAHGGFAIDRRPGKGETFLLYREPASFRFRRT